MARTLFVVLCCWIFLSSMADLSLTVWAMPCLKEENPACQWLLDRGRAPLLIVSKVAGTLLVVFFLAYLFRLHRTMSWIAVVAVSLFQVGLLAYVLDWDFGAFKAIVNFHNSHLRA